MDSSVYARKYMKYKLKYKNLQKSIVQAGGNKYKYRIWHTGIVEFLDEDTKMISKMDAEDKRQLFEFINSNETENQKKVEVGGIFVKIESAYKPISKRSKDTLQIIEVEDDEPAASQAAAPLQPVVLSQAAKPSFSTKEPDIITIMTKYGEYEGFHLNGIPHGKGKLKYTEGHVYTGAFVNGLPNGEGTYEYTNGNIYTGVVENDTPHGKGKLKYTNGDVYTGAFVDGLPEGEGTREYTNGNIYTGAFVDGTPHGEGTLKHPSGDIYTGVFVDGIRSGEGTIKYTDGCVYTGAFVNELPNGKGRLKWPDGDIYEGDFVNGISNGKGKYLYSDGIEYEGNFTNGDADVLKPIQTKKSEPYSITLFINAHGCEVRDLKLPVIYSNIELEYVNSASFGCSNFTLPNMDIAYTSVLFNTKTHIDAVKQYRMKKGKSGVSEHKREYNRMFKFGLRTTDKKPDNYDIFDGIIIIQNTLGMPNNVNLFDLTKQDKINASTEGITRALSETIVPHLTVGKLAMKGLHNTIALSNLLFRINIWFSNNFPGKILNLTIIDNSCRVYC